MEKQWGGGRKSLKSVEGWSKSFLACFGQISIKIMLNLFAGEASEENIENN